MTKEELIALGLTEEQAKKVLEAVKEYVPKTQLGEVEQERDSLKATIAERDTQLETLKKSSGDNAALQQQIADLQKANEEQRKAHDAEITQLRLDNAVEAALLTAGAKNVKAVRALMDADKLKLEKDGTVSGLSEQIKTIQKSDDYLFAGKQQQQFRGFQPGASGDVKPDGNVDVSKMTYSEMVAYLEANPGAKI
ncbi:phage scaffolding protein [Anaerotruncus sp. 1XD42-93]|uniref:phage scaffolding protein n=1 Tax=Anaerotruncus sp. 1XD42-93 TaxID=2320853 RepID=UPI000EA20CDF|nr:phage scaffolding protein [Anaerotruncus sp. 1XD42-93]NBK18602.1 hypothetical protein [Anaerotruncus sp. 1XD42-93]RKJ79790.1 hypothetical protein D7Y41_27570 [Anaerotruncus sp. 1XD22-93]